VNRRRGEKSGFVSVGGERPCDHRRRAAFSFASSDVDVFLPVMRVAQIRKQAFDALEMEVGGVVGARLSFEVGERQ